MTTTSSQTLEMEQNTVVFPNTHDLTTLKWVDFLEIIKTEKHEILDVNYSQSNTYSEKEKEFFRNAWADLQDDAFLLEENDEAKMFLKKSFERLILSEKIRLLKSDFDLLVWLVDKKEIYAIAGREDDYFAEIQEIYAMILKHEPKLRLDYFGEVNDNLKKIEGVVLSYINEYNTKHKDIAQKVEKSNKSIFYNVLQVNRITGLNLNAMTMVVAEWLEAKKIALEVASKQQNSGKNE